MTNFKGWTSDKINAHLDALERACFGGRLAELPVTSAPRVLSGSEKAALRARAYAQASADQIHHVAAHLLPER